MSERASNNVFNETPNTRIFSVTSLLTAHHFTYNPELQPYEEEYPFAQIFLTVEGRGTYRTDGKTYPITAGDMVCRPANKRSMISWETGKLHFLLVSFACTSEAMKAFEGAPIPLCGEDEEALFELIKICKRIFEPMEETSELRGMRLKEGVPIAALAYVCTSLERFLTMLYCRLHYPEMLLDETQKANTYAGKSSLVLETERYLHEHITDALTMADICSHLGISQTALSKKFHAETGCGVMEYFNRLKIERAKVLICQSTMNFTQISEHLGFSSVGYFGKSFKAKVGLTLTEFSKHAPKRRTMIIK
ncbi:MAG: AraC family transcriptional regulator [Ruminococcaceae bacterium]|nr:AraC family transcriptional regulator [Oscillospiraceae bacterium]